MHPNSTALNAAEVIARAPPGTTYDDFALDERGDAFLVTSRGNTVEEVGGGLVSRRESWLGTSTARRLRSPRFGRTARDGEVWCGMIARGLEAPVNEEEVVGGQLVVVDTGDCGGYESGGGDVLMSFLIGECTSTHCV